MKCWHSQHRPKVLSSTSIIFPFSPDSKLWKYSKDPIKACSRVRKYSWIQYWRNETFIKTCESIRKPLHWIIWVGLRGLSGFCVKVSQSCVGDKTKFHKCISQQWWVSEWVSGRKPLWFKVWLRQCLAPSKRFPLQKYKRSNKTRFSNFPESSQQKANLKNHFQSVLVKPTKRFWPSCHWSKIRRRKKRQNVLSARKWSDLTNNRIFAVCPGRGVESANERRDGEHPQVPVWGPLQW